MTKIVFNCNTAAYATGLGNSITNATVAVSDKNVTVTFDSSVTSFVVEKLTEKVFIDSLEVTYAE